MKLFRVLPICMKDKKLDENDIVFEREIDARQAKKEYEKNDLPSDVITLEITDDKIYYIGCHPEQGPIYCLRSICK